MHSRFLMLLLSVFFLTACVTTTVITPEEERVPEETDEELAIAEEPQSSPARTNYAIDDSQSSISFLGKSNIINHEGKFNAFDVTITPDTADPEDLTKATVEVVIEIASVETDTERLTQHLQKTEFFDVQNYPQATFASTAIRSVDTGTYEITGNLSIKGVTKTALLRALVTDDTMMIAYDLPRQEFGVGNDSYGNKLLEPFVPVEAKLVFFD